MAVFRMKDPETWLPLWSRGKNLPALKAKVNGVEYDIPPAQQHGGFEVTVTGETEIRRMAADPRWTQIS